MGVFSFSGNTATPQRSRGALGAGERPALRRGTPAGDSEAGASPLWRLFSRIFFLPRLFFLVLPRIFFFPARPSAVTSIRFPRFSSVLFPLLSFVLFLSVSLLSFSGPLHSQSAEELPSGRVRLITGGGDPAVVIEADEMEYSEDLERAEFRGNVEIRRGDELITGERAIWHEPSGSAEIAGSVFIHTQDFKAQASRAAVNMDLRLAKIYDGRAFFPERHYYIYGAVLERRGPETLYVRDGVFTTCDGPEPSWSLTAERILVNRGGFAESTGLVFHNQYFPMLYLPYLMVPVKTERQSGFLLPQMASTSRDGFMVALPFFFAAAEDYDFTLIPVYRSKRGLALTLEGRYNLNLGEGIWLLSYLKDKKDNFFEYHNPRGERGNSRDLYWLRTQNNWKVRDWDLNLDLDIVSDPLLLYSFRNDLDGFYYSRDLFEKYFGRTVNEELDPSRLSTFFAQKSGRDSYFRGSLIYTDNLYKRGNVDTLQNLPSLYYSLVSRPVGRDFFPGANLPRIGLDLRYDYFTRRVNSESLIDEGGHRFRAEPSLFWHNDLFGVFSLNASAAYAYTAYSAHGRRPLENGSEERNGYESARSGSFEAELSTSLSRVYEDEEGGGALLHQIVPTVSFQYVEAGDQGRLPYFDLFDRALKQRTARFGLRNTLTRRDPVVGEDGEPAFEYREFLTFGVFHSYEFQNNLRWAEKDWARYFTTGYFERGAGPWEFELEAYLRPHLSARILSSMDGRFKEFNSHDISFTVNDLRGDKFSLIYEYKKPSLEYGPSNSVVVNQSRGELHLNLTHGWAASFATRYDLKEKKGLDTAARLTYASQCYAVNLVWEDSGDDRRIAVMVNLLGLGSFGNADSVFSEQNPYQEF
jgi:LPS-assembly protein